MRQRLHNAWIVTTLLYAVVRIVLAARFLAKYGLNTRVFAFIELSSSLLLGYASGHAARSAMDREHRKAVDWAAMALFAWAVPDVYVFTTTRHLPLRMLIVLIVIVVASLLATVVGLARNLKEPATDETESVG